MALKKPSRLLEDPPSASPSQELEEEDLEEEPVEESEEEQEEENDVIEKIPQISKPSQKSQHQPEDEGSEEEEEGSEMDDDNAKHSPTASSFFIKPAVNKNSHSMEPTNPTTKRALIDAEGRKDSSKKTKVTKDHSQEDRVESAKKVGSAGLPLGRVWSSDDVIAILGGMIHYQKQKGADPHADTGAFLEFMKGRFAFEVTRSQLYEKIRSLKRKFFANLGKGESFVPTKDHDIECFELSKKIWGGNNAAGGVGNSGGNANGRVVSNGVENTEHVKIVEGVSVTKKSAKGKSSEGKRKDKGDKKKKESDKKSKKKMCSSRNIVEKEVEPVTDEDIMKDKEDDDKVTENQAEPVTDDDVMKDKEDDEKVVEKEAEPVTDAVMKDKEAVVKHVEIVTSDNEKLVEDGAQTIPLKYPNLIASLSLEMPESRRKFMMEGICLVDSDKVRELEDRWEELRMKEAEFYCRKLELMAEQSRLVMAAMQKKR